MIEDFGESKVTVEKAKLLTAVKANRSKHRETFLEARTGFVEKAIELLERQLLNARNGKPFDTAVFRGITEPTEHTRDYDRVIAMLEMSLADTVTITEQQFSNYVLDEWNWKATFMQVASTYSKGA